MHLDEERNHVLYTCIPVNDNGITSADQALEMLRARRSIRVVNAMIMINQQVY